MKMETDLGLDQAIVPISRVNNGGHDRAGVAHSLQPAMVPSYSEALLMNPGSGGNQSPNTPSSRAGD